MAEQGKVQRDVEVSEWQKVPGFWSYYDWMDYEHLVNSLPDEAKIAEIGCFRGKSLASISNTLLRKGIDVFAIDLFDQVDDPNYIEPSVQEARKDMLKDFKETIYRFDLLNNVKIIPSASLGAAPMFGQETLDMVFIDADHSYGAVKADIEAWWPKVKVGGVMSGHDYDHNGRYWPGVKMAVHERFGQPYFGVYIWSVKKTGENSWETEYFLK